MLGDTLSAYSTLSNEEMVYARVVAEFNDVVIRGGVKPSLAEKFAKAVTTFGDQVRIAFYYLIFFLFSCNRKTIFQVFTDDFFVIPKSMKS